MQFNKKTIILTSNEPWGDIWYSKQHYANELAQIGHQVYFINSPLQWKIGNLLEWKIELRKIHDNLFVVDYKNIFPLKVFPRFFLYLNDLINTYRLKSVLKIKAARNDFWQFDFQRFIKLFFLRDVRRIYHVVDPYMHSDLDGKIAGEADLIVCTSKKYVPYYEDLGCKRVISVSHGVSNDEFLLDSEEVARIRKEFGKFAIFIGTLNDDVSFEILTRIAEKGISLHILGKTLLSSEEKLEEWEKLKNHPNIHHHGVVSAKELKNYIAVAQVGLVAYHFDLKKIIGSRSPLKILNYIAQKIPVVTSIDSEITDLEGGAIYRASDTDEFIEHVDRAMRDDLKVEKESIDKYLESVSYKNLIDRIIEKISQ